MSTLTTYYPQAGIPVRLTPPRPGIYYPAVAIYNPSPSTYTVQIGPNQNILNAQQAQLFSMASSGATPLLSYSPSSILPYGTYLGPVTCVWFEPDEQPGSFPVPLGSPTGIVNFTGTLSFASVYSGGLYFAPGFSINGVIVTQQNGIPGNGYVYSEPSADEVGDGGVIPDSSNLLPINPTHVPATDSYYELSLSAEFYPTPASYIISLVAAS